MEIRGTLATFGHDPTEVAAQVLPRSVRWRAVRAGAFLAGGVLSAPVVAVFPPHVAWALGAVVTGIVFATRKWAERFSLLALEGTCPRCGAAVQLSGPMRLRNPWSLSCEACHHGAVLTFPEEAFEQSS